MRRDEALKRLRGLRQLLHDRGIAALYLYGSVARDEADADSDIDVLVDVSNDRFTAFDLVSLKNFLSEALGAPVEAHDYGGYERLPSFRARVEADLLRVF